MAEVTLNIEPVEEAAAIEDVQEAEHEIQDEEIEAWSAALRDVTAQMGALSQSFAESSNQSTELRQLVQTQAEMIRDLMAANATANAELLQTVRTLLIPPAPVVEVTQTEIPPVEVQPETVEAAPEETKIARRFRGI